MQSEELPLWLVDAMERAEDELQQHLPTWARATAKQRVQLCWYYVCIACPAIILCSTTGLSYGLFLHYYIWPLLIYTETRPALYFYQSAAEFDSANLKGWVALGLLTFFLFFFLLSYVQAACTPPGTVPRTAEWLLSEDGKDEGRVCLKCNVKKPPRTHHCAQCATCVLLMDHHCNWLGNCVGYNNFKSFLLAVFYAVLSLAVFLSTFWECVPVYLNDPAVSAVEAWFVMLTYTVLSVLFLVLLPFLGFHLWLLKQNRTTIEYFEKKADQYNSKSCVENLKEFLGSNYLLWLLPITDRDAEQLAR